MKNDPQEKLNAICPYFTMFPLNFPKNILKTSLTDHWVLDPFCGRGTTNYAARLHGIRSIGIDSSQIATAIAEAKMAQTTPENIINEYKNIIEQAENQPMPEGDFWDLCFHHDTLQKLSNIRNSLLIDCSTPEKQALRAIILGSLHGPKNKNTPSYFSNQMPRTYASKPDYSTKYWKERNLFPQFIDPLPIIIKKSHHYYKNTPLKTDYLIYNCDIRNFDFSSLPETIQISKIISSPPYYGMKTYISDQWLRNWFLGGPPYVDYSTDKQLAHNSAEQFSEQLALVWKNIIPKCIDGATFFIRFGGIRDRQVDPRDVMKKAIHTAGFEKIKINNSGNFIKQKRQAEQFKRALKPPVEEFDFSFTVGE